MKIFTHSKDTFDGEYPDEEVVLLLRRHWFVLVPPIIASFLLALFPFTVYLFFGSAIANLGFSRIYWFLVSIYFIVLWQISFYYLTMYLLDVWIVTNRRIIDSRQKGFFNRAVSEAGVSRIQDASASVDGIVATFLNFGTVSVQTAGAKDRFEFKQVSNPTEVRNAVMLSHQNYIDSQHGGI
jgi:hypothetical protein